MPNAEEILDILKSSLSSTKSSIKNSKLYKASSFLTRKVGGAGLFAADHTIGAAIKTTDQSARLLGRVGLQAYHVGSNLLTDGKPLFYEREVLRNMKIASTPISYGVRHNPKTGLTRSIIGGKIKHTKQSVLTSELTANTTLRKRYFQSVTGLAIIGGLASVHKTHRDMSMGQIQDDTQGMVTGSRRKDYDMGSSGLPLAMYYNNK